MGDTIKPVQMKFGM